MEFEVLKVTTHHDRTALKCKSEACELCFVLFMEGSDEDTAPTLHIRYWPDHSETPVTAPIYPFVAAAMPEKVQGMINMAEQWLIHLDCTSF